MRLKTQTFRLLILVAKIYQILRIENKSVKLRGLICYNYLFSSLIQSFYFISCKITKIKESGIKKTSNNSVQKPK